MQPVNEFIAKLESHFGITQRLSNGGFILPDGRLLDLKRSDLRRKQYHHVIAEFLPADEQSSADEVSIIRVMARTGLIRYEASGRIHVAVPPTAAQRRRLYSMMKYQAFPYQLIVSHPCGLTLATQSLMSPSAGELKAFFDDVFSRNTPIFWRDEVCVEFRNANWWWRFRPTSQVIARQDKFGLYCYIDASFLSFSHLIEASQREAMDRTTPPLPAPLDI